MLNVTEAETEQEKTQVQQEEGIEDENEPLLNSDNEYSPRSQDFNVEYTSEESCGDLHCCKVITYNLKLRLSQMTFFPVRNEIQIKGRVVLHLKRICLFDDMSTTPHNAISGVVEKIKINGKLLEPFTSKFNIREDQTETVVVIPFNDTFPCPEYTDYRNLKDHNNRIVEFDMRALRLNLNVQVDDPDNSVYCLTNPEITTCNPKRILTPVMETNKYQATYVHSKSFNDWHAYMDRKRTHQNRQHISRFTSRFCFVEHYDRNDVMLFTTFLPLLIVQYLSWCWDAIIRRLNNEQQQQLQQLQQQQQQPEIDLTQTYFRGVYLLTFAMLIACIVGLITTLGNKKAFKGNIMRILRHFLYIYAIYLLAAIGPCLNFHPFISAGLYMIYSLQSIITWLYVFICWKGSRKHWKRLTAH